MISSPFLSAFFRVEIADLASLSKAGYLRTMPSIWFLEQADTRSARKAPWDIEFILFRSTYTKRSIGFKVDSML